MVFREEEINSIKGEQDFYALWTQKEAIIKALGTGFSLDPKELFINEMVCTFDAVEWCLLEINFFDGYSAHLCTPMKTPVSTEIMEFNPKEVIK